MVEINLLPWRMYLKEHIKEKNKKRIIFSLLFSMMVWGFLYYDFNRQSQMEHQVIDHLKTQLTGVSKLDKKSHADPDQSMQHLLSIIQHNQTQLLRFFSQFIDLMPEEIQWENILSQDEQIILTGETSSYQTLIEFIRLVDEMKNSFRLELIKMKQLPHSDMLQFSLQVYQVVSPLSHFFEKIHAE